MGYLSNHASSISVIVPAFKQEKTIVKNLRRILRVLSKIRYKSELICVVDGNIDKTYEKLTKVFKNNRRIKIVGYETNRGKGYALRYGMVRSKGDIVAFIDAGMDINPNGLSMLLEHFEWYKADVVVGSKRHPASKVSYPWQRRVLSFGYQAFVFLLFGLNVRDTQVGLKFYRKEVLEKVIPRLLVKAFAFDIEILAVAYSLGFKRIFEAPIELKLDFGGTSELTRRKVVKSILLMIWDTLAVFYRLRIINYYSNNNKRKWRLDPELSFRVNTG